MMSEECIMLLLKMSIICSYFDLYGERFAASVALNLKHIRENYDDAILGLHKTVKRHVVHGCLQGKIIESVSPQVKV